MTDDAARRVASAPSDQLGAWQPIATAPRDGTAFLGYMPGRRGYVARQDVCPMHWSAWGGGTWENSTSGHHIHDAVTHWMPLPAPPGSA